MGDEILVIDDALPADLFARLTDWAACAARAEATRVRPRRWTRRVANSVRDGLRLAGAGAGWRTRLAPVDAHNLADISFLLGRAEATQPAREAWAALSEHLAGSVPIGCELAGPGRRGEGAAPGVREGPAEHEVTVCLDARWAPDWGGETVFLDAAGEAVRTVAAKPNRVVVCPVGAPRAIRSLSRSAPAQRRTLSFRTRARRGEDFEALSGFLSDHGALECDHYVGTLHDHLMRTYVTLADRGAPRDACLGAGLHSVYGTSLLDHRLLEHSERAVLRDRLGEGPETLAYLFSLLDRPRALDEPLALDEAAARVELRDGESLGIPRRVFEDLRWMECANLADQDTLKDYPSLEAFWATGG